MPIGFLPAYLPAYIDWRHTAGKSGRHGQPFDIESVPKDIISRLDKEERRLKKRNAVERDNYIGKVSDFRSLVMKEFEEKGVSNPKVGLYGDKEDPKTDMIYIQYTVNEKTQGKIDKVLEFVRKAFVKFSLEENFRPDYVGTKPDFELEIGERVYLIFIRNSHPYSNFKQKEIDYFQEPEEDDMGGF
jgi:hypothetical protein